MQYSARLAVIALGAFAALSPPPARAQAVAELDVTPRSVDLAVGQRAEVLATAYDRDGDIMSVAFQWSSSPEGVVRVEEEAGLPGVAYLIGVTTGTATVTVRTGNRSQTVSVRVSGGAMVGPQGTGQATVLQIDPTRVYLFVAEDKQLRLLFLKDDGSPAAGEAVTWRSFRPDVATVDANGRVVGIAPGTGLIEAATASGLQRRVQVQVGEAEWDFGDPVVSLSPAQSDSVRVVVPSQQNRPLDPRQLRWGSSNPNVVTISPIGVATAISAGSAEIGATGFGQERRVQVVVHREVDELSIVKPAGDTVMVPMGGMVTFRATALAADRTPIPEAPIIWLVTDTSIATYSVDDTAVVGKGIGFTSIGVRAPGDLEQYWTINVVAAGLVLSAERLGIGMNDQVTLEARYADELGVPLAPATSVRWTSSDPGVVRVDPTGALTPVSLGRAQIVAATPWGNVDTATVIVQGEVLLVSNRGGSADIYAFERTAPGQLHQLTSAEGAEISPAYSPDGSRIAFVTDRHGEGEIYVMDADGTNERRLTTTPAMEGDPTWTPDGSQILYHSDAGQSWQVWIMNADGSNQRQLTSGEAVNWQPAVSPDGETVAFVSARDGSFDVFLMNLDGTNQRNVTNTAAPVNEQVPAWVDENTLAYVREDRRGGNIARIVVSHTLDGELAALTQQQFMITNFALAKGADMLAAVVALPESGGRMAQRVILLPLGAGAGAPIEVPLVDDREQMVTPAFRR
jgi:hypothetical protein